MLDCRLLARRELAEFALLHPQLRQHVDEGLKRMCLQHLHGRLTERLNVPPMPQRRAQSRGLMHQCPHQAAPRSGAQGFRRGSAPTKQHRAFDAAQGLRGSAGAAPPPSSTAPAGAAPCASNVLNRAPKASNFAPNATAIAVAIASGVTAATEVGATAVAIPVLRLPAAPAAPAETPPPEPFPATDVSRGGVTYVDAGNILIITNSTISGNSANYYGGVAYIDGSSTLTITNSTISGNSAVSSL
ncbi:hypothetical protein CYMTET_34664 [Cymbomonas tetramitiformis]|uniref:Right handed beta helix domain-containing protein n=1 Tax=Cymbomonas tetramitiformis TaxID=36881 RepID=A0AAE0KPQ6_9CHLO|nr:hypothetical protein CYMTET_34664 [Cymbomonas tetramitiformis]